MLIHSREEERERTVLNAKADETDGRRTQWKEELTVTTLTITGIRGDML